MRELPVLTCERLTLSSFALDDAMRVQELAGAKEVAATTSNIPHPYADGLAEAWINGHVDSFQDGKSVTLAIRLKDSNELIGAIELMISRAESKASLGYWIGKQYWNNGYCTEAARALLKYGFVELN